MGLRNELDANMKSGAKVYSRGGKMAGRIVSNTRDCQMEGCMGIRIGIRWKDGHITYPCSRGMKVRKDGTLQIE